MKQKFIKVKIYTDKGYRDGFIDVSKVFAFRESAYDCNVTIVYTENETFTVYVKIKELCEQIGMI